VETDHEEKLGALTDLQRAGKIRDLGSRRYPPAQMLRRSGGAEGAGIDRYGARQPPYSILVRGIETEGVPTCERRHGR